MSDREFLIRLLRLLADDDGLDPDDLEFAVITGGTRDRVVMKPGGGTTIERGPVSYYPFEKGEIIVLPREGHRDLREGRSVSKYSVREERFGRDYEAAKRRSSEVERARDVDAFAGAP